MQHKLRAHSVLPVQKSADPDLGSGLYPRKPGCSLSERNTRYFAFDPALVARFDLQRLMREPELQKGQPSGRMAQRFDAGNHAGQANRVTVHLCRRL